MVAAALLTVVGPNKTYQLTGDLLALDKPVDICHQTYVNQHTNHPIKLLTSMMVSE